MDDFVSRVVEQMLTNVPSTENLPERPNYQRQKAKGRIITQELPPLPIVSSLAKQSIITQPPDDNFAVVRCAALKGLENISRSTYMNDVSIPINKSLVDKQSCINMRMLEQVDKRITDMLGIHCRTGETIALISHKQCAISCLLAIDELLQKFSPTNSSLTWNSENDGKLVFCFSGTTEMVDKALHDFENNIKLKYHEGLVCIKDLPSLFLQRYLKISGRYSLAVCEGVNMVDTLFEINDYYHNHKESMVKFKIQGETVIAQGEKEAVIVAMEEIHLPMISNRGVIKHE